jgi:hypothetical protein
MVSMPKAETSANGIGRNQLHDSLNVVGTSWPRDIHGHNGEGALACLNLDRKPRSLLDPQSTHNMSEPSSSYADILPPSEDDEVDSLPSSSAGSSTSVSPSEEEEYSDAEREWRESLQQLELLLTMVLVPYIGKYFGRKCAYWGMKNQTPQERCLLDDWR